MRIKVKKLNSDAVIPSKANEGDAGFDLTAVTVSAEPDKIICYGTGLAIAIPEGYVGLLFPRSSVAKKSLSLANSVGVLDSGYRGEVKLKFRQEDHYTHTQRTYQVGERVGQLVVVKLPELGIEEVDELDDTSRGSGGFGSSGS